MQIAPPPVLSPVDQAGPQRVSLDVAAERVEVVVGLNRERLEPALIEMTRTGRLPLSVPSLRMRERDLADEPRQQAVFLGPGDKMPVVRHQTVSRQSGLKPFDSLGRNPLEGLVIAGLLKDRQPRIGPIKHVIRKPLFLLFAPLFAPYSRTFLSALMIDFSRRGIASRVP